MDQVQSLSDDPGTSTITTMVSGPTTLDPITTTTKITDTTNPSSSISKKSLGLLAKVAVMKRHEENMKSYQNIDNNKNENSDNKNDDNQLQASSSSKSSPTGKSQIATTSRNRQYTLKQIAKFSEKRLLSTFVEYKRDIKTKRCSYRCQMLPIECQQKFDSVLGSTEAEKSKQNILAHLRQHVCNLEQTMPQIKLHSCRKFRKIIDKTSSVPDKTKTNVIVKPEIISEDWIKASTVAVPQQLDQKPQNDSTPILMLKEHAYSTCYQTTSNNLKQSTIKQEINEYDEKIDKPKITITATNVPNVEQPLSQQHTIEDVSQTVEVIASTDPAIERIELGPTLPPPSSATIATTDPAIQANLRALALDYIDDIRKKSSSAAKSIIVNGDKSVIYQCKICPDKQFTSTNGLIFHYKKHAGLKPYVCELCAATFTRQHSLNYHMLIHLNKSRFVCSECSRHFRHPSHFKEHMRRHTGETPFQCSDCLIRFKTRNTYKRHLQTKHSKILTSKGIIELTTPSPNSATAAVAYPTNVPNKSTKTSVLASKGGALPTAIGPTSMVTIASNVITGQQASTSTNTTTIIKPRRKYGLRYLHKNIETITKYEQQFQQNQQQHPATATLITHHHHNLHAPNTATVTNIPGTDSTILATAGAIGAATAQTAPGSNITILSIPQFPTVHILDNGGTGSGTGTVATTTAIARKTSLLNYNHRQHLTSSEQQPASITLVSVGHIDHEGKTVLTPIQMTNSPTTLTNEALAASLMSMTSRTVGSEQIDQQQQNLTELTSAIPLTSPTAAVYHLHHPNPQQLQGQILSSIQPTNITTTMTTTTTTTQPNDNFMRLLEAIELTEVE